MIVAIDGPAGSGKTTVAKLLAKKMNISYLDTGATYRALTLAAVEAGADLKNSGVLVDLAKKLDIKLDGSKTYVRGRDVSSLIREPQIDKNISVIVAHPQVREVMVELQREMAKNCDFVVEGRDITTVVFPNAEYKFYLDADLKVRAERRLGDFKSKDIDMTLDDVEDKLKTRDDADMNREVGALVLSSEAILLDTTDLSVEEVVGNMILKMEEKNNE